MSVENWNKVKVITDGVLLSVVHIVPIAYMHVSLIQNNISERAGQ